MKRSLVKFLLLKTKEINPTRCHLSAILILLTIELAFISWSNILMAQNLVKGSLTVDNTTAVLTHVYFDQYRDEFTIIITDNPIAPEMIPDGIYALSQEGKIRALEFTVSRETQKLISRMRKSIYFYPVWEHHINIGDNELTISRFDEEMLVAKIKTASDNESEGHIFAYDVTFSVSLKKEPLKMTFTGNDDQPSKDYAAYCQAILDNNIEEFKKYISSEKAGMMPADSTEVILGIEFVQETMMTNIEILSCIISGSKAVLTMSGSRGLATATVRVIMLLENGIWKVSEESWQTGITD